MTKRLFEALDTLCAATTESIRLQHLLIKALSQDNNLHPKKNGNSQGKSQESQKPKKAGGR
jgi:hypothetical protein